MERENVQEHIDVCLKMFHQNALNNKISGSIQHNQPYLRVEIYFYRELDPDVPTTSWPVKKINSRNAWNMNIIDYMRNYISSKKENLDSLLLGSTSLEVGAKVYSVRVDDVHSMALKLAADLSKMTVNQEDESNSDEDNADDEVPQITHRIKKRNISGCSKNRFIAKDVRSLYIANISKVTSAFHQMNRCTGLSKTDNFLTCKVSMDKSGCIFTFMNNERLWTSSDDPDPTLNDKQFPFLRPFHARIHLCPEFENFNLNECTVNETTVHTIASTDEEMFENLGASEPMDSNNDEQCDEIDIFRPSTSGEVTECSSLLSGKCITNIWRGPTHWKFKNLQRYRNPFTKSVRKKKLQKKNPEEDELINFFAEAPTVDERTHRNILLTPSLQTNKFHIPINKTNISKLLNSYFLKPSMEVSQNLMERNIEASEQTNLTPYDNDITFCDDLVETDETKTAAESNEVLLTENPTDMLNYASTSKTMDMNKLKDKVWSLVTDFTKQNLPAEKTSFKKVYTELPNVLNEPMKGELSSHLAFLAVLHLASDKNLNLVGQPDLKDFNIEQDPE